jgi:hemerythrin-like domain-containing protein
MTAAQRVCEMLRTEHEATRRDLAVLVEAAAAGRRGVPDLPRIRALMESVQVFERDCHAAKEGELLLPAVRVRSKPDADRLLRSLQQVKLGCDEQFAEAFELLGEAERRGVHVTDALLHALQEHRATTLRLMKAEEQLLYSLALRVLGEQDWLRLAADMWGVDHPGHALYRHETSAAAPRRPLGADLATH